MFALVNSLKSHNTGTQRHWLEKLHCSPNGNNTNKNNMILTQKIDMYIKGMKDPEIKYIAIATLAT